jgi:hypothetical protein
MIIIKGFAVVFGLAALAVGSIGYILLNRKPRLVVAVALANKTARIAWAIMSRPDLYRHAAAAA